MVELPKTALSADVGIQFASHYTKKENKVQAVDIAEIEEERKRRKANYAQIAHDYYELATFNLEYSWGRNFHFSTFLDNEASIREALAAHDHFLWMCMGVKPGMKGLDAGCGIGEPARQCARWADTHVTGISINQLHIDRAKMYAKQEGRSHCTDFVRADFMKMPFPDNSFDFVYAQEATVYASDLTEVYTEIARVLKPGGTFGVYEWCMTPKFDDKNPMHVEIRQRIERGDGVVNMQTTTQALAAIKAAGFEVIHEEDRALVNKSDRQWWFPINGETKKTTTWSDWWLVFRLKPIYWGFICVLCWIFEKSGLAQAGQLEALETQAQSVWGMRDGGKEGVFTNMYMMVGKKPEDWVHPKRAAAARGKSKAL